jgi:hypothetical protein
VLGCSSGITVAAAEGTVSGTTAGADADVDVGDLA